MTMMKILETMKILHHITMKTFFIVSMVKTLQ